MGEPKTTTRGPILTPLAHGAPTRQPTVRVLAAFAGHADCNLAALGFAAGVDFDQLLTGTEFEAPFGQSPFAFSRGRNFERSLREGGYGSVFELLRERMGFAVADARVMNLREGYPPNRHGLVLRAHATRGLLDGMLRDDPSAYNLIDGGVLTTSVGGVRAYFEADALAARAHGPIRIGEVKSFPVVDDRGDPEKVGAALDQAAMYIHLTKVLAAELRRDPGVISTEAMLITPRNVGLRPMLSLKDVETRVERAGLLLSRVPSVTDLASLAPPGASFGAVADHRPVVERRGGELDPHAARRVETLHVLADDVGTTYVPACLSTCGLGRFCRERAFASGSPQVAGGNVVRLLPGIHSLNRAADLADGAPAGPVEAPAAAQLARAARLYDRHTAGGHP
jgi:hypothetical protein